MTDKTKKIIAREGFILLGVIIIGSIAYVIGCATNGNGILGIIAIAIILGVMWLYPLYLLIRFLIWAIKAFKEKKINKNTLKRAVRVAFDKDTLIRIILILGILYLSVSLLKSCGVIKKRSLNSSLRLLHSDSHLQW